MKKIITIISAFCLALVISCGPSAEEKAKMAQQQQDSLNAVKEQLRQDSITLAEHAIQDSLAAVQKSCKRFVNGESCGRFIGSLENKRHKKGKNTGSKAN